MGRRLGGQVVCPEAVRATAIGLATVGRRRCEQIPRSSVAADRRRLSGGKRRAGPAEQARHASERWGGRARHQNPLTTPIRHPREARWPLDHRHDGSTAPSLVQQWMDDPELYGRVCGGKRASGRNQRHPISHGAVRRGTTFALKPDGEVRWVPDTPHHERQRALGKTLMAQDMPDGAIETILWMDNERHLRDSGADEEPVKPVKQTASASWTSSSS